jgi:hypothetical protein
MSEWDFAGSIEIGATGRQARLVQEWLSLQGFKVSVDGQFGPATEVAVRAFQKARGLQTGGVVNGTTFAALVAPMVAALAPINPGSRSLGALTLAYARQHLAQSPREVGGENMGPWVRLYMKGNEGAEWAWCAGFVGYVLRQAAKALGVSAPLPYTFSCDSLAAAAKDAGMFLDGRSGVSPGQLSPGSLFLVRRTPLDWVHTGLVLSISPAAFETIEGNTNDSGDREGYEVCRRTRGYDGKDFVVIA